MTNIEKALKFRELHRRDRPFIIPNPWDAGSARLLASLGFEALATSSVGSAGTYGRRDHRITRNQALALARAIVNATNLPVSADLGNGFGDSPKAAAETVHLAAEAGLVGCSIEDASGALGKRIYDLNLAADRIAAAAEAARGAGFEFVLTARAENYLHERPDLDDTINRLVAYEKAGADVLFAPGLPDLEAVRAVCSAVTKPVNFMAGIKGKSFTVEELAAAGAKRISLGSSLYRAAMTALATGAREVKHSGSFDYLGRAMTNAELNHHLGD